MNRHNLTVIEFNGSNFQLLKQLVEHKGLFDYELFSGKFRQLRLDIVIEDVNTHLEVDRFLCLNDNSQPVIDEEFPNLHFIQFIIEHDFIKPVKFSNDKGGSFIAVRNDKHLVDFLEENVANLNLKYKCNVRKMSDMLINLYRGF